MSTVSIAQSVLIMARRRSGSRRIENGNEKNPLSELTWVVLCVHVVYTSAVPDAMSSSAARLASQ